MAPDTLGIGVETLSFHQTQPVDRDRNADPREQIKESAHTTG